MTSSMPKLSWTRTPSPDLNMTTSSDWFIFCRGFLISTSGRDPFVFINQLATSELLEFPLRSVEHPPHAVHVDVRLVAPAAEWLPREDLHNGAVVLLHGYPRDDGRIHVGMPWMDCYRSNREDTYRECRVAVRV